MLQAGSTREGPEFQRKRFQLAQATLERALEIAEHKMGHEHSFTGDIVYELGCFYMVKPEELGADIDAGKHIIVCI